MNTYDDEFWCSHCLRLALTELLIDHITIQVVNSAVNRKLEENVWKNCSRSLHFKKLRCRVFLQLSLVEMNSTVHIVLHPLNIKLEESLRKKSVF